MNILPQEDAIKIFAPLMIDKKLIPIFGAGFSKGSPTQNDYVIDGYCATEKMKDIILRHGKITNTILKSKDFSQTAELFLQEEYVPVTERQEFFRRYFTEAKIPKIRKDFLCQIEWPFVYTLNVDDAIENTGVFTQIMPYKPLNQPQSNMRLLYKIHGDAKHEILYSDDRNVVFSSTQYIQALQEDYNLSLLNNFSSTYAQFHILFIGCSLSSEPDIKIIYERGKRDRLKDLYTAVLRTREPSEEEIINFKKYGINTVILATGYEVFYQELLAAYQRIEAESTTEQFPFINPIIEMNSDSDFSKRALSSGTIFRESDNAFYMGGMHVFRYNVTEIENAIIDNDVIILKGPRFSGKTDILSEFCSRSKNRRVFFFPTTTSIDEDVVVNLLETKENCLFVFDSNSYSSNVYRLLANSLEILQKRKNKLVIAMHSNDNYLSDQLNAPILSVQVRLYGKEREDFCVQANRYGLLKRTWEMTHLDYLSELNSKLKLPISVVDSLNTVTLTQNEKVLMVAIAALDKLFFSDIMALGIPIREVPTFCEKLSPAFEICSTVRNEVTRYSTQKLVHQSKRIVLQKINQLSNDEIVECIIFIVKRFVKDIQRRQMYIDLILFDTLNQLLERSDRKKEVIAETYEKLEEYLNQSSHYWLQRAKSIYRMHSTNQERLKIAYGYARKAYEDGGKVVSSKASLSLSLINGLLSKCSSATLEDKHSSCIECVFFAYEAIFSLFYTCNKRILKSEILGDRRGFLQILTEICLSIDEYADNETCIKAKKIEELLKSFS